MGFNSLFKGLMKLESSWHIFEKHSNFMKIHLVGAELFHVDRQTDIQMDRHDEANRRFLRFCKYAQKGILEKGRKYIKIQKGVWEDEKLFFSFTITFDRSCAVYSNVNRKITECTSGAVGAECILVVWSWWLFLKSLKWLSMFSWYLKADHSATVCYSLWCCNWEKYLSL